MTTARLEGWTRLAAIAAAIACVGCGAGEYRTQYQAAKTKYDARKELLASFDAKLDASGPLGQTGLSGRLPQGMLPLNGPVFSPQAMLGYRYGGGFQTGFSVYNLAADEIEYATSVHIASGPLDEEAGLQPVLDAVKQAAGAAASGEWEEVQLIDSAGAEAAWQRVVGVTNDVTDQTLPTGRRVAPRGPTNYVIYVRDLGGTYAVLVWRVAQAAGDAAELQQLSDLSTGTVSG